MIKNGHTSVRLPKSTFLLIAFIVFVTIFESHSVSAETILDTGSCGPALTYTLFDDGVLEINGSGAMTDAPWKSKIRNILMVSLPEELTEMCDYAFDGCSSLTSVEIPEGVTEIPEGLFCDCYSLKNIDIQGQVTHIRYAAFMGCSAMTSITLLRSLSSMGGGGFLKL